MEIYTACAEVVGTLSGEVEVCGEEEVQGIDWVEIHVVEEENAVVGGCCVRERSIWWCSWRRECGVEGKECSVADFS